MTTSTTFRVSRDKMQRLLRKLPSWLSGARQTPLYHKFAAELAREILRLNFQDIKLRSKRLPGVYSYRWLPHAPSTVKRRNSPSFKSKYPGVNPADILVRTYRLINSLKPGQVIDSTYVPPNSDQSVTVSPHSLRITTKVPYARKATTQLPSNVIIRSLFPNFPVKLIKQAISNVVPRLLHAIVKELQHGL